MRKLKKEYYIEVYPKMRMSDETENDLKVMGMRGVFSVRRSKLYALKGNLDKEKISEIASLLLSDPVSELFSLGTVVCHGVNITIFPKPSVLDIEGRTAEEAIKIMGISGVDRVRSGRKIVIETKKAPSKPLCKFVAERLFFNPIIEEAQIVLNFKNGKK